MSKREHQEYFWEAPLPAMLVAEAPLPPLRNGDKIRQLRMKVAELDRLEKATTNLRGLDSKSWAHDK